MRSKADGGRLRFIEFQQPTLVDTPPDGDGWLHEIKYDGYRTELLIERGKARALTRRGFDWTGKYGPIVEAAAKLPLKSAIVDGEVIVMNDVGLSDFSELRSSMRWQSKRLVFVGFDLLYLDGKDLRQRPLIERRSELERLVGDAKGAIQFSHHIGGSDHAFYEGIDRMGIEGMVSKRRRSLSQWADRKLAENQML